MGVVYCHRYLIRVTRHNGDKRVKATARSIFNRQTYTEYGGDASTIPFLFGKLLEVATSPIMLRSAFLRACLLLPRTALLGPASRSARSPIKGSSPNGIVFGSRFGVSLKRRYIVWAFHKAKRWTAFWVLRISKPH